ncbi:MAG: hypothetical protein ACI89X_004458 [Planctomycetota bacterium]|jgi:hypothetical protein
MVLLATAVAAQQDRPQKPKPSPAQAKAIARVRADLTKASKRLEKTPHAYKGSLSVLSFNENSSMVPIELDFTGATDGTLDWFFMDGWSVAARGRKVAVANGEQPWTEPQGDSPDVPISPLLFVPHLLTADLALPKPAEHEGRPALRVYAKWTGKPVKKLLFQMTVPSSQHEQVLESLANAAARGRDNLHCDATFLYDPASREWMSATLRFVYLDGRPIPEDEMPPKAPTGLPALQSHAMIEATWHMERSDFKTAKRPEYDARARQLLRLDKKGAPIAAPKQPGKPKKPSKPKKNAP